MDFHVILQFPVWCFTPAPTVPRTSLVHFLQGEISFPSSVELERGGVLAIWNGRRDLKLWLFLPWTLTFFCWYHSSLIFSGVPQIPEPLQHFMDNIKVSPFSSLNVCYFLLTHFLFSKILSASLISCCLLSYSFCS